MDLAIKLDRNVATPLHQQLYEELRQAILNGLLAWAQQTGTVIIEDDYDSEYRYGSQPLPALQGIDRSHRVIYTGSFSKVLFPSLRIGYLVLPRSLVALFASAKWLSDRQLPLLEQQALTDFIEEGHFERHIRRMRSHYDRCRLVLVRALNDYFGKYATILGENAGIHLMVKLHTTLSDEAIIRRATKVGSRKPNSSIQHNCELNLSRNYNIIKKI